ncbi:MAG: phosphatidate cytidylyltransferase [Methanomicrobiales archaeon]|nr:phosphatidate cytidylyltransferase [Methanomicrobiales archaeon]
MDETLRQLVHLVYGLLIVTAITLLDRQTMLMVMMIALFAGLLISDVLSRGYRIVGISTIVDELERPNVFPGKGAIYFLFSSLVCLFLFGPELAAAAVLCLAVLDCVATIAGIRYGRHRVFNGKSVEGTIAGIAAAALVLLLVLPPSLALAAAVLAGVVELLAPLDDNLLVPPCVGLLLTFLG